MVDLARSKYEKDTVPDYYVYFDKDGLVTKDRSKAVLKKSFTLRGWEITIVEDSG